MPRSRSRSPISVRSSDSSPDSRDSYRSRRTRSRRRHPRYRSPSSPRRTSNYNKSVKPPKSVVETEKVFVGMENAPDTFGLRGRLLGEAGSNFEFIRTETGAMVSLQGGKGSIEALHILLHHLKPKALSDARLLASNLIKTIKEDLKKFTSLSCPPMDVPPPLALPIDTSVPPPLHAQIPPKIPSPGKIPPIPQLPLMLPHPPPLINQILSPPIPPPNKIPPMPQFPPILPHPPPLINQILPPPLQIPSTLLPESPGIPPMDSPQYWHLQEVLMGQSNPFQMRVGFQGMIPIGNESQPGQNVNLPLLPGKKDLGFGSQQISGTVQNNVQQLLDAQSNMRAAQALLQETIQQSAALANSVNFSMGLNPTVSLAQNAPAVPFEVKGNMPWNNFNMAFLNQMPIANVPGVQLNSASPAIAAPDFSQPPPGLLPLPTQLVTNSQSWPDNINTKRSSRWETAENVNSEATVNDGKISNGQSSAGAQTSRSSGLDEAIAAYMKAEEASKQPGTAKSKVSEGLSTVPKDKQKISDIPSDKESLKLQLDYIEDVKKEKIRRKIAEEVYERRLYYKTKGFNYKN